MDTSGDVFIEEFSSEAIAKFGLKSDKCWLETDDRLEVYIFAAVEDCGEETLVRIETGPRWWADMEDEERVGAVMDLGIPEDEAIARLKKKDLLPADYE